MKEGFIVANLTNYGDGIEVFGVYKNRKRAERQLRKVVRARYGKCPRILDKLSDYGQPNGPDTGDSYQLVYFKENGGEL